MCLSRCYPRERSVDSRLHGCGVSMVYEMCLHVPYVVLRLMPMYCFHLSLVLFVESVCWVLSYPFHYFLLCCICFVDGGPYTAPSASRCCLR